MNNLSNSMDEYNRNIDSIGTEISYSSAEDFAGDVNDQNQTITIESQNGGKFLNFLFGNDDEKKQTSTSTTKVTSSEMTELIMRAIDKQRYDVADFLLEQKFVPDMNYLNEKRENLINALVKAREKMQNADKALAQLIPRAREALNVPDISGLTPFFAAVRKGYNDVAQYMEKFGAKRVSSSGEPQVVSEYDMSDTSTESAIYEDRDGRPVAIDVVKSPSPIPTTKSSIFVKPDLSRHTPQMSQVSVPDISRDETIADIVKAFRTRSANSESEGRDIVRTDIDTSGVAQTPRSSRDLEQHINKVKELMSRTAQQGRDTIHKISTRGTPVPGQQERVGDVVNPQVMSPVVNPVANVDPNIDSDEFVEMMARKLSGRTPVQSPNQVLPQVNMSPQPRSSPFMTVTPNPPAQVNIFDQNSTGQLVGGARKKNTKVSTKPKTQKVVGKRTMISFSELSDNFDMFGGMSENEMRNISRAALNQKNKFHEEAVEKILAHLPKKDIMTAKAVKAIIYDEIKQKHKEMSGLDRAAEVLRSVTKTKVDEVLKQTDLIKKIVDYLEHKNAERDAKQKGDKKQVEKKGSKTMSRTIPDFESSVTETSDYQSESSSDSA